MKSKSDPEGREYYVRTLPHWTPKETAIFVTWRLWGPLPASVTAPVIGGDGKKFAAFDRAIENYGPMWLRDERLACCIADALQYSQTALSLCELHAWVIMPNHVHVLWTPKAPLDRILGRLKTYTARECNRILERTGPFWQRESFDHWVRSEYQMQRITQYIESNPVKAGLCKTPESWRWSSAFRTRDPLGRNGSI